MTLRGHNHADDASCTPWQFSLVLHAGAATGQHNGSAEMILLKHCPNAYSPVVPFDQPTS